MRAVLSVACGLDVHKRSVTACLIELGARGQVQREVRTFETTTSSLLELASWLSSRHCQHVAMESTGVYWKPVFNVLEGVCEHVMLVNAQHIKAVPGRKTDVKDSEWIADLLVYGLLTAGPARTLGNIGWRGNAFYERILRVTLRVIHERTPHACNRSTGCG